MQFMCYIYKVRTLDISNLSKLDKYGQSCNYWAFKANKWLGFGDMGEFVSAHVCCALVVIQLTSAVEQS